MGGSRRVVLFAGFGLLAFVWACAGGLVRSGDRLAHARLGGSIGDLARLDPAWREIDVEGATLAYRGPGRKFAAWIRECRGARDPDRLAQALLFEWEATADERTAREVHGAPGVALGARSDAARLLAVTRAGPACSDDFVLVAPLVAPGVGDTDRVLLERWVASFDPGSERPIDE